MQRVADAPRDLRAGQDHLPGLLADRQVGVALPDPGLLGELGSCRGSAAGAAPSTPAPSCSPSTRQLAAPGGDDAAGDEDEVAQVDVGLPRRERLLPHLGEREHHLQPDARVVRSRAPPAAWRSRACRCCAGTRPARRPRRRRRSPRPVARLAQRRRTSRRACVRADGHRVRLAGPRPAAGPASPAGRGAARRRRGRSSRGGRGRRAPAQSSAGRSWGELTFRPSRGPLPAARTVGHVVAPAALVPRPARTSDRPRARRRPRLRGTARLRVPAGPRRSRATGPRRRTRRRATARPRATRSSRPTRSSSRAQPPAYGGGPTGELVLNLRKPFGAMGMISPVVTIDGHPAERDLGPQLLPGPGRRPADRRRADLPVDVRSGLAARERRARAPQRDLLLRPDGDLRLRRRDRHRAAARPGTGLFIGLMIFVAVLLLLVVVLAVAFGGS